jgi:hypothetical protein
MSKPDWIDKFFDWIKMVVREHMGKIALVLLTALISYISATWKQEKVTFTNITMLPSRFDTLSSVNKGLISAAYKHHIEDSIHDAKVDTQFVHVQKRMNAQDTIIKNLVTLAIDHDNIIHPKTK